MSTEEEQRGLLGEPAQGASAPPPQEVPVPVPAADVAAEFESNSGHTMVIRSSPGPAPAQDWAQSCDRGELGKHVDALYSFLVCGANDGGESSSGGVFLVAKGAALPPSSGKQENVGRVVYRVPGAPADDAGTPPAVRLMNVRGLSRCGLEAVMATLGQLRAARVKAGGASAGEAATMDPAAMMAAWMAAQAAGGGKKERNAVVEALCCIVSPIYEFVAEFAGASVWQPIKDCCRSKDKAAAAAPATAPKPSEAGVLDLLVAVRPAAPEQEEELTIFVRAKDAAAMAEFVALWTETLLPAAVAAQDVGAAGPVVEALEGAEVQAQPPTVDRFERPYIDAVRALTKYAKPCEKALIFLATAGLGFNAGAVSQVASITSRIVVLVLSEDYDAAQDKAWEIFMWGAIFASIQLSAYFILERSAEVLSARFRRHYFKAMLRQDQEWFDVQPTSLTTDLTQDVNMVRDGIGRMLGMYINMQFMFPIALTRAFIRGPKLAAVLCLGVPFMWKAGKMTLEAYMKAFISSKTAYAQAAAYVEEILSSMATLTSIGAERRAQVTYASKLDGVFETLRASAWKDSKGLSFLFFIMYFMSGVGIIAAAQFIADDPEYDAGVYMEVSMNVMWGSMMLGMVTMIAMPYKLAITASRKMLLIIQRVPAIDAYATDGLAPSPTTPGELMLRNVRFAYPKAPGTTVLKGVSLTVPPGSVTALVGGSGSGKSTVIRLLQRLYDPIEGVVLLDGVPLRSLNVKELRKVLGVVSQEPLLFNCSIEENIRLGAAEGSGDADAPPVTQAEIEEACRVANALEFIQQDQENGFQTIVGRGGGKLSGGQKQRIAIARAMVRRPRVLLLDEATSALDENSQELVQANVEAKMRELGGTTVMVAHRQTTYMNASCIVCFCNGHISEHATSDISDAGGAHDGSAHSKLMRNNGEYHALFTGCTAEEAKAREEAKAVEAKAAAVVKADDVKPIVKLERTMSDDEKTLRRTISQKVAAIGPPQALQRLDTPPKRCCNYIQRVIAMLGPQALQKKDFRWVIPCLMVFSALYGAAIPGMMLINAEAFVNFGRCLPTYSPANRTLVMLDPVALDLCHDEMISTANVYAALYFGFSFCALGLCYIKQVSLQLSIACVSRSLRNAVFGNVVRQEFAWFDDATNSPFAISSRLADDADLVAKAYGQPLSSVADMIVALALAYSVALAASWQLVFATVAILPLMAHGARKQHGMREGSQKRAQNMIAEASTIAGDAGQDIGTVAAFSMQEAVHTMYEGKVNERVGEGVKYAAGVAATFMFQETGRYLNQFIVYCYGSHLGGAGHITGADIIRADQAITGATFSTMSGVGQLPDLAKAQSAQGTIFTIIDRQSHIDTLASMDAAFAAGGSGGDAAAKPSGDCGFDLKGVSFSYPSAKDKLALVDVNLQIRGGESTALVGGSGSGKTTIVKLLQRLYDPSLGTVLFDGHDLSGVDPAWLRRQLAVVGQEPVLYNASIMDNVKYGGPLDPETGEPTATDEQAIAACKRANAHDFVEKLPEGYQTQVQRSGGSLSGGQKQRIAIARAIIREPYVFLLDEATSALDSQSESTVKEALERETAGKTVVVIAHRLTTTKHCDNIVLMDHGTVMEEAHRQGSVSAHAQLIANDGRFPLGLYAQLWAHWEAMDL